MSKRRKNGYALVQDIVMISIGILAAIFLSRIGVIDAIVASVKDYYVVASFITGIFFTSAFTIAPSSIALAHIAQTAPTGGVVLWGALGAVFGDVLLFTFIRDRFARDLMGVMKKSTVKHIMRSLHFGFLKWLSPLLGALIIASPLPDEFAITLFGMSKVRLVVLIPVAFIMNMLGIYVLIQFSHLL